MVKKPISEKFRASRSRKNQVRERVSFAQVISLANRRAHEQANRRMGNREKKFIWAAVAEAEMDESFGNVEWTRRLVRWSLALLLLPFCWVTSWTFLCRFSAATVNQEFWKTAEFWYFTTGALVMMGWFWSGLLQTFFLYMYVLGHELTHAICVLLYRGKVTDFHVSVDGGYITTNKTNLVIALSPYFVPFWSVVAAVIYAAMRYLADLSQEWDRAFYAVMGATWTFHMIWTLWMIPRDQPDLRENGTFLSLVIIYLANLILLAALLCCASGSPLENAWGFGMEWLRHAATAGDSFWRYTNALISDLRAAGRF
ncbi:MAG: hypothetical protein HC845_14950 [Akkermansiaceae bacterium]|nr:hypothetical protein [Akkermansiaceae bacterium]